jgi:hypothetical protein
MVRVRFSTRPFITSSGRPRESGDTIFKKKARFPLARERAIAFFDYAGTSGKSVFSASDDQKS